MVKIIQENNSLLRQVAQAVPNTEVNSLKLKKIIAEMNEALDKEEDGVAIAAPQIGVSLRIFIVSHKILANKKNQGVKNQVYINPVIKKISNRKISLDEGCLSVRWIYGKTKRADKILIEAYNEKGNKFAKEGTGLLAQVFQHETDHLDGVLFIDHATELQKIEPEKK